MTGQPNSRSIIQCTTFDGDLAGPALAFMIDPASATGAKVTIGVSAAFGVIDEAFKLARYFLIRRIHSD